MDMSVAAVSPAISLADWLVVALVFAGPIGLFILRRRLADAHGGRRVLKAILVGLTAVTAPLAALLVIVVVAGAFEAGDQLWSLARAAW
jgi:hypothetical protein